MILVANGDSNTYGHGVHSEECFGAVLAKRLGWEFINIALEGGSNDYILRSSLEYLYTHQDDLFFVVGWSEKSRREWYFAPEQEYHRLAAHSIFTEPASDDEPHKLLHEGHYVKAWFADDAIDDLNMLTNIFNLQNTFRINNIPFIMFDTITWFGDIDGYLKDEVCCPEYRIEKPWFGEIINKYPMVTGGHPGIEGHVAWADTLYEHLQYVYPELVQATAALVQDT